MEIPQGIQELGGTWIDGADRVVNKRSEGLSGIKAEVAKRLTSAQSTVRIAALAAVLLSAGCGQVDNQIVAQAAAKTPIPISTVLVPTSTPEVKVTPTPTNTPEMKRTYEITVAGANVTFAEDGTPLSYKLPDSETVNFDPTKLKEARQKAIANKEPEIFDVIPIPVQGNQKMENDLAHPVLKELPRDVMTTEELEERGVKIVQPDNTELWIRKSAFDKDGPLSYYAQSKHKLTIVLINAPVLSDVFMRDPRYKEVRDNFLGKGGLLEREETEVNIEKYRQERISEIQTLVSKLKKDKGEMSEKMLEMAKLRLYRYQKMNEKQLLYELAMDTGRRLAGGYMAGTKNDTIYLAVGKSVGSENELVISVDQEGKFTLFESISLGNKSLEPQAKQSFPDPATFYRNPDASSKKPMSYPYGGVTPGFVLRHEGQHSELMFGQYLRIKREDFKKPDGSLDTGAYFEAAKPNFSEYDTDEAAMQGVIQAWERWKNSGFKDDSGYPFVFRVPEGYILTKNQATVTQAKI